MMHEFIELVELRTKIASVTPFLIANLCSIVVFHEWNALNMTLFFVAMLAFDMATTVMNNLMDYVKAKNLTYKEQDNIIGTSRFSLKHATMIFVALVCVATVVGVALVLRTNVLLLFVGMLCFAIGIFYTFGPIPISRMPLGEVLSGVTMGYGIFWIVIFLNVPSAQFAQLTMTDGIVSLQLHLMNQLKVMLLAVPFVCTIANIMLSNNLCDLETDITNHRYTLVYYIGRENALLLYQGLYAIAYVAIVVAVLVGVAPWPMLFTLVTILPVYRHIQVFLKKQEKRTTFALAIKNMLVIHAVQLATLVLSAIIFR